MLWSEGRPPPIVRSRVSPAPDSRVSGRMRAVCPTPAGYLSFRLIPTESRWFRRNCWFRQSSAVGWMRVAGIMRHLNHSLPKMPSTRPGPSSHYIGDRHPRAPPMTGLLPPVRPPAADRDLLRAFLADRSEPAFAELVRRHGPVVFGVCRRVLGDRHDAEDAFQAAFLVLARKAADVRKPDALASWLYGVAYRTARELRSMRDRRRTKELGARSVSEGSSKTLAHASGSDLAAVLDEELARLPEHYRLAVVLCELHGRSRKQAAAELGVPEGTL